MIFKNRLRKKWNARLKEANDLMNENILKGMSAQSATVERNWMVVQAQKELFGRRAYTHPLLREDS